MWGLFASLIVGVVAAVIYNRINSMKFREISKDTNASLSYQHKRILIDMTTVPKFTFDQFLKFYNLNPEAWEIMNDKNFLFVPARVKYEKYKAYGYNNYYYTDYEYYPIFWHDNYEFKRYCHWATEQFEKRQKNEIQKKQNAATKQILEFVQADIDRIRAENEATLQKTEEVLTQSLKNLREETKTRRMTSTGIVEDTYYCGVESNNKIAEVVTEKQIQTNDIPQIIPSSQYKILYYGQELDLANMDVGDIMTTIGSDGFTELIQKISETEIKKIK